MSDSLTSTPVPVLVITGPPGVGKTSVAGAASDSLGEAGVSHALVDLDYLRWCFPSPPGDRFRTALGLRNLAAVWANCRAAGAERLILVDVVETRRQLDGYQIAVPGAAIIVARLSGAPTTIHRRLESREVGASLGFLQRRAAELSLLMERNRVEDLLVNTDGKGISEVAREVLVRSNWVSGPADLGNDR